MGKNEIEGPCKTFVLYVKLPEELYPLIKKSEGITEESVRIYNDLFEQYIESA